MSDEPNYETPHGEGWPIIAVVAEAAWLEPQDAAEVLRRLSESGYRVVPSQQRVTCPRACSEGHTYGWPCVAR